VKQARKSISLTQIPRSCLGRGSTTLSIVEKSSMLGLTSDYYLAVFIKENDFMLLA